MKIDIDDEYKKLCYIQQIKPGKLRHCMILSCIFLTILTALIPLLLYWKWQRFRNIIHNLVFQEAQSDSEETNYYLIVDSKKLQGKQNLPQYRSRNISFRNTIVSPYLLQKQSVLNPDTGENQQKISKYIEHKNLKYLIKDNILHSLKFKVHKLLSQSFQNGISSKEIDQSLKIYGKAGTFLMSFHHIFYKIIHTKRLRVVFMFFAIKKVIFGFLSSQQQQNSAFVSVFILSQLFLTFFMILIMSILGARQHNKIHEKLQNHTSYQVIRQGQKIEVKLNNLYVGDIVIPKKGEIIYFKGLIAAQITSEQYIPYMVLNEKLYNRIDKPIQKTPIISHLNEVSQHNLINPGSLILSMGIKKDQINKSNKQTVINSEFYIIVTDNNFIQKFYTSYQEKCYFDNFQTVRHAFDSHQLIFQAIFFILAIMGILMAEIMDKSQQNWIEILLSLIVLCFPFNLALFTTFTEFISVIRLRNKQVSIVNPLFQQIGISDQIFLELSAFQTTQFSGFIKKQRCSRIALPENFQDSAKLFDVFRRAREQSIFTFLGWTGIMNLPYFHSDPILKEIFQNLDFTLQEQISYSDDQDQDRAPRVRNNDTSTLKIYWKEFQRFQISQKFIQSVVIQDVYTNRFESKYFVIVEGEYTNENCDEYFNEIVDEVGRQQYKQVMKRIYLQGKKIKYISLKRLNANNKDFKIHNIKRESIEQKLFFGGFLVFDHWPTESDMKILIQINRICVNPEDFGIKLSIFSVRQQNALIGYDHILRNSNILYEMQSKERVIQIQQAKSDSEGVIHIGNGILDRGCLLRADLSINRISESFAQADFQIKKPQQVKQLFSEGIWALQTSILSIICLSLFNFSKIVGQLVLFHNDHEQSIEAEPLSTAIDRLFLIDVGSLIIPLFLLNIYQPTQKLVKKERRTFFRIDLMFHVFLTLIGLLVLFVIELLDHQFKGTCNNSFETNAELKHQTFSRHFQTHQFFNPKKTHSCQGIIDFISISFAMIVIFVIDRQTESRKANNFFIGIVNKIYMIILWIGSIFYFHIPYKSVQRALIVILALIALVYLSDFLKSKKEEQNQIVQNENNFQVQEV